MGHLRSDRIILLRVLLSLKGRLHELKKVLFSAPKLSDLLHTGPKLELKTGPF